MNYTVANEIYEMMMNTSVVKQLIEKNKRLKKENKSLKNLINSLPEFRCRCSDNHKPKNKEVSPLNVAQKEPQGTKKREPLRKVAIKTEEKENIKMEILPRNPAKLQQKNQVMQNIDNLVIQL